MPPVRPINPCRLAIEEKSAVVVFGKDGAVEYLRVLGNQSRNERIVGIVDEGLRTDVVTPVSAEDPHITGPCRYWTNPSTSLEKVPPPSALL